MATKKISAMTALSGMAGSTDLVPVVQSGANFKATPVQLGAMFFEAITENTNAVAGITYLSNVESVGSHTVTLPALPLTNQRIGVILKTKTTVGRAVTINPNGKNINGSSANVVLNVQDWGVGLRYDGAEWRIVEDHRFPASIYVSDFKVSGTGGGTFTSGAWRTRDLNTMTDDYNLASLASNVITLQPGVYLVDGSCPAFKVDGHKSILRNVDSDTIAAHGSSEYSGSGDAVSNRSIITGKFAITAETGFDLRHICVTTNASFGFGANASSSEAELYSFVRFLKIK